MGGGLVVGVLIALACASSSEALVLAPPIVMAASGAGASDAGAMSTFVTNAQRSQVVPPDLNDVERMCALLTSCEKLPIPPSLIPDDFASCVKKMSDDMTSRGGHQLLPDDARVRAAVELLHRPPRMRDARRERGGLHRPGQARGGRLLRRRRARPHVLARPDALGPRLPARGRAVPRRRRTGDLHARRLPRHHRRGRQAPVLRVGRPICCIARRESSRASTARRSGSSAPSERTGRRGARRAGRRAPRAPIVATGASPSAASTGTRFGSTAPQPGSPATRPLGPGRRSEHASPPRRRRGHAIPPTGPGARTRASSTASAASRARTRARRPALVAAKTQRMGSTASPRP